MEYLRARTGFADPTYGMIVETGLSREPWIQGTLVERHMENVRYFASPSTIISIDLAEVSPQQTNGDVLVARIVGQVLVT